MSRLRIYRDGKPDWSPNELGFVARRQGAGGVAMGYFAGTVLAVSPPPKTKLPRQPLAVTRPRRREL